MRTWVVGPLLCAGLVLPWRAGAHCDTTKGPVITAAQTALAEKRPELILHWVQPQDEAPVRAAFEQAVAVRGVNPQTGQLADRWFFETLVRIHRAGEGAPFTGISEADPEPIIAAVDRALEIGTGKEVEEALVNAVRHGFHQRFAAAVEAKQFQPGDVAAGRAFVATYVPLTHWAEGVLNAAGGAGAHHGAVEHAAPAEHGAAAVHGAPATATGHTQHLPWILAGLFGLAAVVEGGALVARSRRKP